MDSTITAEITSGQTIDASSVTVSATAADGSKGSAALVQSFVGSVGGIVSVSGAVADAIVGHEIIASANGTLDGDGNNTLAVSATDSSSVQTFTFGGAIGAIAAGIAYSDSTKSSTVSASIGANSSATDFTGISVTGSDQGNVAAYALAAAGGIFSGDGAAATALDMANVSAFLGHDSTIGYGAGGATINASASPAAWADAQGYGASVGGSLGASVALATAEPTVTASVGDNDTATGDGPLAVAAVAIPGSTALTIKNPTTGLALASNGGCGVSYAACALTTAGNGGVLSRVRPRLRSTDRVRSPRTPRTARTGSTAPPSSSPP